MLDALVKPWSRYEVPYTCIKLTFICSSQVYLSCWSYLTKLINNNDIDWFTEISLLLRADYSTLRNWCNTFKHVLHLHILGTINKLRAIITLNSWKKQKRIQKENFFLEAYLFEFKRQARSILRIQTVRLFCKFNFCLS